MYDDVVVDDEVVNGLDVVGCGTAIRHIRFVVIRGAGIRHLLRLRS